MPFVVLIEATIDVFANSLLWSSVEVNVGIICACLPVMQPVIQKIFGNVLGRSRHSKYAMHPSRKTHISEAVNAVNTAPFRKLDEETVRLPPQSAVNDTWVSAGSDTGGYGEFEEDVRAIPLNAIHVQQNVDLTKGPST